MEILGVDSQRLGEMRDTDEVAYDQVFQKVNFNDFIFKIRAKMDTFNVSYFNYMDSNFCYGDAGCVVGIAALFVCLFIL